jgi:preprotein translocase SecE subunit
MVLATNTTTSTPKKISFFRELQTELKKITWTTKHELIACTKIVLGATIIFSLVIYFADLFIRNILLLINLIFHWIF